MYFFVWKYLQISLKICKRAQNSVILLQNCNSGVLAYVVYL